MKKLKICFLINGFGEGGAQRQCILLLNELQKKTDLDIILVHFLDGIYYPLLITENLNIFKLKKISFYDPRNILNISNVLKIQRPDVIFSWMRSSDFYSFFLQKIHRETKWVMAERNSSYPKSAFFFLRSLMGRAANMIICNSMYGKDFWLNNGVNKEKIEVIPNVLQTSYKGIGASVDTTKDIVIVYAGRLEPQKNVLNMTHAFCRFGLKYPKAKIYIIGSGTLGESIKNLIPINLVKNIIHLPFQKNIFDYFDRLDVFVSISHYEGMPNTVLENAFLGNKMVLSKIPEHVDLLGENYPFYVSDLSSIDEIFQLLCVAVESDSNLIDFKYFKARTSNMTLDVVVDLYYHCFKQLVSE